MKVMKIFCDGGPHHKIFSLLSLLIVTNCQNYCSKHHGLKTTNPIVVKQTGQDHGNNRQCIFGVRVFPEKINKKEEPHQSGFCSNQKEDVVDWLEKPD